MAVCEARNSFTDYDQTPITKETKLQVYYLNQPSVTPLASDSCAMTSSHACVVKEGHQVHVNCSADSNPPISVVAWQQSGDSVLDLTANRQTPVSHVCNVTTVTVNNDDRLPLNQHTIFTILTTYVAEINDFGANSYHGSLTVNESAHVTLNCSASGRPTPEMTITKNGEEKAQKSKGQVTETQTAALTYDRAKVSCNDTGLYICEVNNDQGGRNTSRLTLFVNCSPRFAKPSPETPPTIRYDSDTKHVTFSLLAYPSPRISGIMYRQPDGTFTHNFDDIYFTSDCDDAGITSQVRCNVTVIRMTSPTASGSYRATVTNSLGSVDLEFDVSFIGGSEPGGQTDSSSLSAGVSAAITASVMVIVVVVVVAAVVVWLWRRNWVLPCAARPVSKIAGKRGTSTPEHEDRRQDQTVRDVYEIQDSIAQNVREDPVPVRREYELLRMDDVGQRSVYSGLDAKHTGPPQLSYTEPAYVNSSDTATRHYANMPHQ